MARKSPRPRASLSSKQALIPVRALDFVMYNSKDIRATRAFYQKFFGLKRGSEWNDSWSEFATEPISFCLNGPARAAEKQWDWHGPPCVALAVDDVCTAVETCRRHGARIMVEPIETPVCWMAWIADPDENWICLHSRKDGSAG